jgi:hypothetical protein
MAYCQYAQGDPSWQASAQDVLNIGGLPEAMALVQVLIDPDSAAGPQALPEARPESGPPFRATSGDMPQGVYLRG